MGLLGRWIGWGWGVFIAIGGAVGNYYGGGGVNNGE
jgi:hypothetical protein